MLNSRMKQMFRIHFEGDPCFWKSANAGACLQRSGLGEGTRKHQSRARMGCLWRGRSQTLPIKLSSPGSCYRMRSA